MTAVPTTFQGYANYVAQVLWSDATGTTGQIPSPLASAELARAIVTDPATIRAYRDTIAGQMNAQSAGPRFSDLSDRIADIVLDTRVQGAGTLEVHLIDPLWVIPMSGFITADEEGYLWPPIDVRFPSGTECVWRLCQMHANWGSTTANLVLTFEDRIVSQLRQLSPGNGGLAQGSPNQTLGGFIKQLVDDTNRALGAKIRLLEMISPQDPNYTTPITQTNVISNKHLKAKLDHGLTGQLRQLLANLDANQLGAFPATGKTVTITGVESVISEQWERDYERQWQEYVAAQIAHPSAAVSVEAP